MQDRTLKFFQLLSINAVVLVVLRIVALRQDRAQLHNRLVLLELLFFLLVQLVVVNLLWDLKVRLHL